jgi:outer membrane protein assembly factor BamB
VGSWDNKVYAINADGTEKWTFATGSRVFSSPANGSDGIIYVGSRDDSLYALREVDGVNPGIQTLLLND